MNVASRLVLAMMLPVALAACGSSGSAPNPATGAAANNGPLSGATAPVASGASQVTSAAGNTAGTAGGGVATVGSGVAAAGGTLPPPAGTVVTAAGNTVTATGESLENGALDEPAGVTVVNSPVTDTASNNLANASVLSNTPASNAPVQANAASNGEVASAAVAAPGSSNVPVVSPLLAGSQNVVNAATGSTSNNPVSLSSLSTPSSGLSAVGSAMEQTGVGIAAPSSALPGGAGTGAGALGAGLTQGGATVAGAGGAAGAVPGLGAAGAATAPLNPALNVAVGGTQLVGSAGGGSVLNAGVMSDGKLVNTGLASPAGVPDPVSTLTNVVPK
jgi:hypothetical protein